MSAIFVAVIIIVVITIIVITHNRHHHPILQIWGNFLMSSLPDPFLQAISLPLQCYDICTNALTKPFPNSPP